MDAGTRESPEHKRAQQALRENEEFFRSLSACLPVGIFLADTQARCAYTNARTQAICGFSAQQALGEGWLGFIHPQDREPVIREWLAAVRQGMEYSSAFRWGSGNAARWSHMRAAPMFADDGRLLGYVGTIEDITERKRAEEALQVSEKLAATGRLAAAFAHEINNPLEAVTNLLYILQQHPRLDEEARRYVDLAQEELSRVVHIARQTLAFYRDSSLPVAVKLAEVIDSLSEVYARKIQARNIRVDRRLDPAATVQGYPGELRQVFANLLSNALEAVPDRGTVRVHVFSTRNWRNPEQRGVRVVVADNGPGIAAQPRERIFEPFFTTKGEKGTGLGLWVTLGIVRKYGGSVRVRSTTQGVRTGTCFSVFFPAHSAEVLGFPVPGRRKSTA